MFGPEALWCAVSVRVVLDVPDFAAYMRLCMEVDGVSGDQVAEAVGMSSRMVSYWRTGERVPSSGQTTAITHAIPSMRVPVARALQAAAKIRIVSP